MPDEEGIKTLEDGKKVKFIYQELPKDGAFITAQGGNEVVYSVWRGSTPEQVESYATPVRHRRPTLVAWRL